MSNDPAPKPRNCPFCGNAPYVKHFNPHDDEPSTAIGCDALGCPAKPSMNKGSYEDTLAAWNGRRPQQSAEPVAYRYDIDLPPHTSGRTYEATRSNWHLEHGWTETPLFAASPGPSELVERPNSETQAVTPVESVPVAKLMELEAELRYFADNGIPLVRAHWCADRLSALIQRHRGKS